MSDQSFVSQETRERVRRAITPIAVGAGQLGLTPNALTIIGFLIAALAAAGLIGLFLMVKYSGIAGTVTSC